MQWLILCVNQVILVVRCSCPLFPQPVISDSDDEDGIDGNLFSRKKAPESVSKHHPVPQVKAEVKREVQPAEGRPPSAVPVKEKMPKSDGTVKGVKQELKVVVKREHLSSSRLIPPPPKREPMDTPVAQPPKAKLKQQTPPQQSPSVTAAGKKRPHVAEVEKEEEEESSSSEEEEEDSDSSFDEEPNAQGLDEDESDYEGTASSDDDEFKMGRVSWRVCVGGGVAMGYLSACYSLYMCTCVGHR